MPDRVVEGGARPRLTQNGPRLAIQVVLALLAVLLLLWLANIVTQYDDPVLAGLAEAVSQDGWIGITIFLLIVILAIEILLLVPGIARGGASATHTFTQMEEERVYMIGCSGCGTVFDRREHEVDDEHERRFECPNCARTGEILDYDEHLHDIRWVNCRECGMRFQMFKPAAECPACHVAQD